MKVRRSMLAALCALGLLGGCAGGDFKSPSLYQRLGGKGGLTAIVDAWLARAVADTRLRRYFAEGEAQRIRPRMVDQLCQLTGGDCRYSGRDMKAAHAGLLITDADYDAMLDALRRALAEYRVPEAERKALFELLVPVRKDVILG